MTDTDIALRAREREHREKTEHGEHWWRCMPISEARLAAASPPPLDMDVCPCWRHMPLSPGDAALAAASPPPLDVCPFTDMPHNFMCVNCGARAYAAEETP